MTIQKIQTIQSEIDNNKSSNRFINFVKKLYSAILDKLPKIEKTFNELKSLQWSLLFSLKNIRNILGMLVYALQFLIKDRAWRSMKNIKLMYNALKSIQYTKLLNPARSETCRGQITEVLIAMARFLVDLSVNIYLIEIISAFLFSTIPAFLPVLFVIDSLTIVALFMHIEWVEMRITNFLLSRKSVSNKDLEKEDIFEKVGITVLSRDLIKRLRDVVICHVLEKGLLPRQVDIYFTLGFIFFYLNNCVKSALLVLVAAFELMLSNLYQKQIPVVNALIDLCDWMVVNPLSYCFASNFDDIYDRQQSNSKKSDPSAFSEEFKKNNSLHEKDATLPSTRQQACSIMQFFSGVLPFNG